MRDPLELIGYCGFYCGDCLGYTGVIADAAKNLNEVLDTYKFRRTAECIFPQDLENYDNLCEMLRFMSGLRCPGRCRLSEEDQPDAGCAVRACCKRKGFYACHECEDFETCDTLASLHGGLHTAACLENLQAMKKMGVEAWLAGGSKHHYWDEDAG